MKQSITIKPCHASSVRPDLSKYLFTRYREGHALLLSHKSDFTNRLLCLPEEEPRATPPELLALLLLLLPLLLTLLKLLLLLAERSHHQEAQRKDTAHNPRKRLR